MKGNLLPYLDKHEKQKGNSYHESEGKNTEGNKISQFYVSNYQNWNSKDKTFYTSKRDARNQNGEIASTPKNIEHK